MDVLDWALWGDASDDEASATDVTKTSDSDDTSTRQSQIHHEDAVSEPLMVQMKLPTRALVESEPQRQPLKPERVRTTLRRRKGEITRLRIATDYLEKCLAQLQEQRHAEQENAKTTNAAEVGSTWQATLESDQLQQSQRENEQLREQLRDKYALARELEKLVAEHYDELRSHFSMDSVPQSPFPESPRDVNREVLDGLLLTLHAMYLQTDAVFVDPRYASISPVFTDIDVHSQRAPDALTVELHDSRIVPFDVKTTAKAVWQNLLGRSVRPQSGWVEQLPNETLRSHFVAYMKMPGLEGHVRCIMALRRIVEETRVVFVRCSILTHVHPRHKRPMHSRLLAWIVVRRPLHSALEARDGLAQIQHCSVTVPSLEDGDADDSDLAALAKFYAGASRHFCKNTHDEVDSYLLRRATNTF